MTNAVTPDFPAYLAHCAHHIIPDSWQRRAGRFWAAVAAIAICLVLIVGHLILRDNLRFDRTGLPPILLTLADWIVIALFYVTSTFAASMLSRSATQVLSATSAAPVLYLRSFTADTRVGEGPEHDLERALRPLGPMVAVGLPGEAVPPVGAARLYLSDADWQSVVRSLMDASRLIVLRIGDTPGFWWEVRECVNLARPDRVLIFLAPGVGLKAYDAFRANARDILPVELPPLESNARFLAFDRNWAPKFLTSTSRSVRLRRKWLKAPLAVALRDSLSERFGVKRLEVTFAEWAAVVSIIAGVLSTLFGILQTVHQWSLLVALKKAEEMSPTSPAQ